MPPSSWLVSAFCVGLVAVPETGPRDLRSYTPWISFRTARKPISAKDVIDRLLRQGARDALVSSVERPGPVTTQVPLNALTRQGDLHRRGDR